MLKFDIEGWRSLTIQTDGGCLVWQGRIDANGYARAGKNWAHRAVYEHEVGPIPNGMDLDHTCRNPPCVNSAHLEPVTRSEHCRRTHQRLGSDDRHMGAAYLRTLGMTYADVADFLGYSGRGSAASAVNTAISKGLVGSDDVPRSETLAKSDVEDIIALRSCGVPVREIALWYDMHESQISRVSRGITSGHGVAA